MTLTELQNFWATKNQTVRRNKLWMMVGAGAILGILTPYETSNIPNILGQFAYWIGLLVFADIISGRLASKIFPFLVQKQLNPTVGLCCFSAVLSIPLFMAVIATDIVVGGLFIEPQDFNLINLLKYFSNIKYGVAGYFLWFGQVWLISFLIIGSVSLLHEKITKADKASKTPPAGQLFVNRLPGHLGTHLIALSMEDHYVRAYTENGDTLILMRMADALKELGDYPGIQLHRSWWAAVDAIKKVRREKRKYTVELSNGLQAPVSQTHVEKLKQAGFI